jgi:hypothetical protein
MLCYKIYCRPEDGLLTILEINDTEEGDYDQTRFVRNSEGIVHNYYGKEEAIDKLNEWYKPEQIVHKYRFLSKEKMIRD